MPVNGTFSSVSFYSHAVGNVRLAIFSDNAGVPNTKQWESGDVPVTASAWTTVNISAGTPTSLSLTAGTYWLVWQWNSAANGPSYTAGAANTGNYVIQSYGAFPATWSGGTASTENWSVYATYTSTPTITSLVGSPQCAGGTITINGTNLTGATAANVTIGGTSVSSITSNNGSTIVAVIGAGTTGVVTVTTPGGTASSSPTTFTVNPLPAATIVSPSPASFCSSGTLTASNGNDGTMYYEGTTSNGISTTTASTSQLIAAPGTYYFRAQSALGCWGNQGSSVVTISSPAVITANPNSVTVCSTSGTSFTAAASGTSVGLQWQISTDGGGSWSSVANGGVYSGATTGTLAISNTAGLNGNQYRLLATTASPCSNSVNSTAATLNVSAAPAITTQPVAQTVCAGSSVTFSVVANNATGYQWQKGGVNIGELLHHHIPINPVAGTDAGNYSVIVSGAAPCGSVTSSIVALTVNSPAAITTNPNSVTVCSTSGTSFTGSASGTSISLQWQISTDGGGSWSNLSNAGVYSGVLTGTLTISNTAGLNGNQYRLLATTASPCSNSGSSTAATLNVSAAPTITTQPVAQTVCAGSSVTFSVVANNATGYQWQKGGVNIGELLHHHIP